MEISAVRKYKIFSNADILSACFIWLCLVMVMLQHSVPVPIPGVDGVHISLFELISVAMWFFFAIKLVRRKVVLTRRLLMIGGLGLLLLVVYFIASVYRVLTSGDVFTSFFAIRAVYASLILYLLIETGFIKKKYLGYALLFFHTTFNLVFIVLIILTQNIRLYNFLGVQSTTFYVCLLLALVPLSFYYLANENTHLRQKYLIMFLCMFNITISLAASVLLGMRIAFLLIPLSSLACIIILWNKGKRFRIKSICTIAMALFIVVPALLFNVLNVQIYAIRQLSFVVDLTVTSVDHSSHPEPNVESEDELTAGRPEISFIRPPEEMTAVDHLYSTVENDRARVDSWRAATDEFFRSPILGTGVMIFPTDFTPILPHNFILEYLNAFGGLGFLVWGALYLTAFLFVALQFKKMNREGRRRILIFVISVLGILGISFVQPTMLTLWPNMILWIMFSFFADDQNPQIEEEVSKPV